MEKKNNLDKGFEEAAEQYDKAYNEMFEKGQKLHEERLRSTELIHLIEYLVNSIANHPKEFDAEIQNIRLLSQEFVDICEEKKEEIKMQKKAAVGAGAGVGLGVAATTALPTAAMWIATTFGTASTGTAISALSGAAANSAALAWLGGGALAAGGGGMAMGNAVLALAGPIGWTIAGGALAASVGLTLWKKSDLAKQKKEKIEEVKANTARVRKISIQIQGLLTELEQLAVLLNSQYRECLPDLGKDFRQLIREEQIRLGVLVNNTKSLSLTLKKNVDLGE